MEDLLEEGESFDDISQTIQPQELEQIEKDEEFAKELDEKLNQIEIEKAPDLKPAIEKDGVNFELVGHKKGKHHH